QVKLTEKLGADALVIASPFYFPVHQTEIIEHFKAIREVTTLPLMIYNIPQYTRNPIDAETVNEIARIPGVVAYKDSSGNMTHFQKVLRLTNDLPSFSVFQGNQLLSITSIQM